MGTDSKTLVFNGRATAKTASDSASLNEADCLFTGNTLPSVEWSKQVSDLLGLPISIVHLDELPFADEALRDGKDFNGEKKEARKTWLRDMVQRLPQEQRDIWDEESLEQISAKTGESALRTYSAWKNKGGYFRFA